MLYGFLNPYCFNKIFFYIIFIYFIIYILYINFDEKYDLHFIIIFLILYTFGEFIFFTQNKYFNKYKKFRIYSLCYTKHKNSNKIFILLQKLNQNNTYSLPFDNIIIDKCYFNKKTFDNNLQNKKTKFINKLFNINYKNNEILLNKINKYNNYDYYFIRNITEDIKNTSNETTIPT